MNVCVSGEGGYNNTTMLIIDNSLTTSSGGKSKQKDIFISSDTFTACVPVQPSMKHSHTPPTHHMVTPHTKR